MRHEGKPFRWNMSSPNLLRRLGAGATPQFEEFEIDRLLRCASSVIRVDDADTVFIGRSLESVFDLLSGALSKTTWYDRLQLLQLSIRGFGSLDAVEKSIESRKQQNGSLQMPSYEERLASLENYFRFLKLLPSQILNRERRINFVDVVASGSTFSVLAELLKYFSEDIRQWLKLRKCLRFVAVVPDPDEEKEPNWKPDQAEWTSQFEPNQFREVPLAVELWCFLADKQFKSTPVHGPNKWGRSAKPTEFSWFQYAARGSRELYRQGERSRERFASLLDQPPEPIDAVKLLAKEMRRESRNW